VPPPAWTVLATSQVHYIYSVLYLVVVCNSPSVALLEPRQVQFISYLLLSSLFIALAAYIMSFDIFRVVFCFGW
jgi:hypothetical protein